MLTSLVIYYDCRVEKSRRKHVGFGRFYVVGHNKIFLCLEKAHWSLRTLMSAGGHFSSRTFKHCSLNHLHSQDPKAEGSKVRAALLFSNPGFVLHLLPLIFPPPLSEHHSVRNCHAQSGIRVNL